MIKLHPTVGCCGIDCGLCPRYYTKGKSQCPGCGGEGFASIHPPCSYMTCCVVKHGVEVCAQCPEFPCQKYEDRAKIQRDSFVSHKRIFHNHQQIKSAGIEKFLSDQNGRVSILQDILANYDDGRSKSYFCLAAALLTVENLKAAIAEISAMGGDAKSKSKALKAAVAKLAESEGVDMTLRK